MSSRLVSILAILAAVIATLALPNNAFAQCEKYAGLTRPVCAHTQSGAMRTFVNICFAKAANATVVHVGPCDWFCPLYKPVCARKEGVNRTYANSCIAAANGADILANAPCPGPVCWPLFEPVCAMTAVGSAQTFPNWCEAVKNGARIFSRGKC